MLLEKVLVLFDEVEEFVVDRELPSAMKDDRFLTTYMLPWLQRLHDRGAILFVFATNKIGRFDPAITRPGRFDLVVPLGPPQGDDRLAILRAHLKLGDEKLSEIARRIPPQAAYGEIVAACESVGEGKAGDNVVGVVLSKLEAGALATSADAWNEFAKDAQRLFKGCSYLPAP